MSDPLRCHERWDGVFCPACGFRAPPAPTHRAATEDRVIPEMHGRMIADGLAFVELYYPRIDPPRLKAVQVGLMDVRAADSIEITYDFERDGWVIKQASKFEWEFDEQPDGDWQEVAFVKAWGRQNPAEEEG